MRIAGSALVLREISDMAAAVRCLQAICTYCPDLGVYHLCDEASGVDSHFSDADLLRMVENLVEAGREAERAVLVACAARAKTNPHKMVLLFSDNKFEVIDPVKDPDPLAEDQAGGGGSGGT